MEKKLGDTMICQHCGEHPEQIPARLREHAKRIRAHRECLLQQAAHYDENAQFRYVRNPAGDDPYDPDWEGASAVHA
jgi:hypothetical protein